MMWLFLYPHIVVQVRSIIYRFLSKTSFKKLQ